MVTREPVGNLPATRRANAQRHDKGILQISLLQQGAKACLAKSASALDETVKFDPDRNLHPSKVALQPWRLKDI